MSTKTITAPHKGPQEKGQTESEKALNATEMLFNGWSIHSHLRNSNSIARLKQVLLEVIKTDKKNKVGCRSPMQGDVQLLNGFNFNQAVPLGSIINFPMKPKFDLKKKEVTLLFPNICPGFNFYFPEGANYFQITTQFSAIDLDGMRMETCYYSSPLLPCYIHNTGTLEYPLKIKEGFESQIFALNMSVEYYNEDELGIISSLKKGKYDACEILRVLKT
jgi:hypothetical protein